MAPEDDGTILAAAHRMFLSLKSSLGGSDQGVVNEVERGEDRIKAKFEAGAQQGSMKLSGSFSLKQSDYGIKPYSVFGGVVKVADDVEISGDVLLVQAR